MSESTTPTWASLFARWAESDAPLVVDGPLTWSGRELVRRAGGASALLDSHGAPAGQPVAAITGSSAEAIALLVGGAASRRPLAPLSPRATAAELSETLHTLAPSIVVCEPSASPLAHEAATSVGLRTVVVDHVDADDPHFDWRADPSDIAFILHTSGTTGAPKRVDCRQDPMGQRCLRSGGLMALDPPAVFCTASPFHHTAGSGMTMVSLARGVAVVPFPRFSIDAWCDVAARGVTSALLVPSMIEMLLEAGKLATPHLQALCYGAAPMHASTLRRVLEVMPQVRVTQIFGQTEGTPITSLTHEDHQRIAAGAHHLAASVGRAAPGIELYLKEPDATGLGEVVVRGDHLFSAGPDGWMHTGDLGRLDEERYLYLEGRKGDMIIRGGENVYPEEVERVLKQHPAVLDAAVVGRPDQRLGQIVAAHVVLRSPATADELRAHTRAQLAGFKVPEQWHFVDDLPRNPSGKLLRRLL